MTRYATTAELQAWLGDATPLPPDTERLLDRASAAVAWAVRRPVTVSGTTGLPVDADEAAALRDATTAQVEAWTAGQEDAYGTAGSAEQTIDGVILETVAATAPTATRTVGDVSDLAPAAARILAAAGLANAAVVVR